MIICQRCHAQTDDGAIFCDVCGDELSPTAPPAPQRGWPTAPPQPGIRMSSPIAPAPHARPSHAAPSSPSLRPAPDPMPPSAPTIVLHVVNGQRIILRGKSDYTVGRASAGQAEPDADLSDTHAYEAGVSRNHLMIHVRADGVFVEDLDSTNETVHNGYRLLPMQWYPLHNGDELKMGEITLYVSFERP